jgi:hypothetical protein
MNPVHIEEPGLVFDFISELVSSRNLINHNGVSSHQEEVCYCVYCVNLSVEEVVDFVEGLQQDTYFLVAAAQRYAVGGDYQGALLEVSDQDVKELVGLILCDGYLRRW